MSPDNPNYLVVCTEGNYLGRTFDNQGDLFRLDGFFYKVNREDTNTILIPDNMVEYFLYGKEKTCV